jgi:predicted glycogen debranching enzyme
MIQPLIQPTRVLGNLHAYYPDDPHLNREFLVTNGLGGYASGTVAGSLTRRYHGLLIAALPNPLGRFMMLNALSERMELSGGNAFFAGPQELSLAPESETLVPDEFRLEAGMPVWVFAADGLRLEKRLRMPHGQNTVYISYSLAATTSKSPERMRLELHPWVNFRSHDGHVTAPLSEHFSLNAQDQGYELSGSGETPVLRLFCDPEAVFTLDRRTINGIVFSTEKNRGYDFVGSLFSPGHFCFDLVPGQVVTLIASSESWDTIRTLGADETGSLALRRRDALLQHALPAVRSGVSAELVMAADQFVIKPAGRAEDEVRAHAAGGEVRTAIAGYHWFTDWGRDTMISFEGLTLTTGRHAEAGWILHTFAHYIKDGLIPNMFPEGEKDGLYHTADASLWFFHAVSRYLDYTDDQASLKLLLPKLREIADAHLSGTRFGIHVDPADGLLSQGAPGYQLTWMDAKVGNWVVTPRRGKAVEINALWYNALSLLAGWMDQVDGAGAGSAYAEHAVRARACFNERFWCESKGYLFDVVDGENGDDASCRPNQVFAISLQNAVLDPSRWEQVMDVVTRELLTPVGLRSLSPRDPEYKAQYRGDLPSRDGAYHQGSVWAWLIGPYIDGWLKLHPDKTSEAAQFLKGFVPHLDQACVGSISEIFDAEEPHTPRGCIAQAWSVAEVLRCWARTQAKTHAKTRTEADATSNVLA